MELIRLENVKKIYQTGEVITKAVDGIDFTVDQGEFALIIGASGAGKTTVLNILGGMDTATSGAVYIDGEDISKWNKKQLTGYRRDDIGFVFQFYNLVPNLTATENVELALQISKNPLKAEEVLKDVGLAAALALQGEPEAVSGALALALGIGLQNIPEGAAVSLPLLRSGQSRGRAFLAGAASGLVEPLGGLLALAVAGWVSAALPWLMSAAAGCMVCVTAQEMIPQAVEPDESAGVISIVLGFALMMALDVAL